MMGLYDPLTMRQQAATLHSATMHRTASAQQQQSLPAQIERLSSRVFAGTQNQLPQQSTLGHSLQQARHAPTAIGNLTSQAERLLGRTFTAMPTPEAHDLYPAGSRTATRRSAASTTTSLLAGQADRLLSRTVGATASPTRPSSQHATVDPFAPKKHLLATSREYAHQQRAQQRLSHSFVATGGRRAVPLQASLQPSRSARVAVSSSSSSRKRYDQQDEDMEPTLGTGKLNLISPRGFVEEDEQEDEKSPVKAAAARASEAQLSQLMGRYYSSSVFDRLKNLVTKGGVTLQDCIASGSFDSSDGSLEIFAGDYESYHLFSPLFDPVIRSCHPLYQEGSAMRQATDLDARHLSTAPDPDPAGTHVHKARLLVARNLAGFNLTPKMSVQQLREVERRICQALERLPGPMKGSYTSMRAVMADMALQEELERAELPQTYRLTESAGMLSAWPEGRGIFLNADRSLCIFVNVEDHLTVVCTANAGGGAKKAQDALELAESVLNALSASLSFEFDPVLGYITPSPAKLGTALAFSLVLTLPPVLSEEQVEGIEERFPQVCVEVDGEGGGAAHGCIVFSRLSLGITEVDAIRAVLECSHSLLQASA